MPTNREHVQYYWITATDPESGKPYLIAGGTNEDESRQKAFEMLAGIDFQLVKLPTRSLAKASQLIKGTRLEKTKSLHKAAQRMGHDKTLERRAKQRGQHSEHKGTSSW